MGIIQSLQQRRAVRSYEPREVEDDKISTLLEAASWAPNDRLREPWHFYVIRGEAKHRYEEIARQFLEERFPAKPHLVKESLLVLDNTPLIIVVTADLIPGDDASSEDNEYAAACAIHSMWLAAQELGLGLVWRTRGIGLVRDERLHRFIGAPDNRKIIGSVFAGYPSEETPATKRSPSSDKTTWL
ncbi:nitroreductase [Paenibacillus allorhizosphaerae]|uniref:NAD(P)H nitroreductase YdjA n=1 Tax=Paenibacillus allorhizosphaerae TaxID=2849866 RepID=A0ABM8VF89_9BACL|nr:nitroreductase [Paenibacillus allorhizosphaerae]CAG7633958.1 Putative NAD(P)H nitroreductase YdjA [Paenibacillus allorhizosphaerae]